MSDIQEIYNILLSKKYQKTLFADILKNGVGVVNSSDVMAKCPFHSDSTPSFSISLQEPIYYCFGCGESGDWLTYLQKRNGWDFKQALSFLASEAGKDLNNNYEFNKAQIQHKKRAEPKATQENAVYMIDCNESLINNQTALNILKEKKGISKKTADFLGIGIDVYREEWVFPIFKPNSIYGIYGFERRPSDFGLFLNSDGSKRSKCLKTYNPPNGFAAIKDTPKTDVLIILEGFIDAYCYYQFADEQGFLKDINIYTTINGVRDVFKGLYELDSRPYKKIIFLLDNDDEGHKAVDKIKREYKNSKFEYEFTPDCKDFGEWYLRNGSSS
jgi:hypothetical protein